MATSSVSDEELGELAGVISSRSMYQVAITCLGVSAEDLDSQVAADRENQWKFNFTVLKIWKTKAMGNATKQKLAQSFTKVAENGLVDYRKIQEILKVDPKDDSRPQEAYTSAVLELDDERLLNLSQLITEKEELRVLAIKGLRMENHLFARHVVNHPQDIGTAAYNLLTAWRTTQPDKKVAYAKICNALESVNMSFYIGQALK